LIFIFGIKRRVLRLGAVLALCSQCRTPAAQVVNRVRTFFSLFFIPIVPIATKYRTTCTMCGVTTTVSREVAERLVAEGNTQRSAPSGWQPGPTASSAQPDSLPGGQSASG
jgi:zinc-ribbon family